MKVLLILGMAFGAIMSFASYAAGSNERKEDSADERKVKGLVVSLVPDKLKFKPTEEIKLQVLLTNSTNEIMYVFGTLDFGLSAGLTLHLRDAFGKEVKPEASADALTPPLSPDDVVKLLPDHFHGANFVSTLKFLNLSRPGKYSIFVDYHSPISASDVKVSPFWGKERGTITSNVVHVEVLP
jgi:hypothetical protein